MEKCLKYGGVQPTQDVSGLVAVPDIAGMTAEEAREVLQAVGLKLNMIGSGKVVAQSPAKGVKVAKGTTVDAYSEDASSIENRVEVPNVHGLSAYEALIKLRDAGLEMRIEGADTGKVTSQSPTAGSKVESGEVVTVQCNG